MASSHRNKKFQIFYYFLALLSIIGTSTAIPPCIGTHHHCKKGFTEIYRDDSATETLYHCCNNKNPGAIKHSQESASGCTTSPCVSPASSDGDLCSRFVGTRTIKSTGKTLTYVEAVRDNCVTKHGSPGIEALCCGNNTLELSLTTLLGVEPHEFPHFARLEVSNDHGFDVCGGTIYNERHILTASHCVTDKEKLAPLDANLMTIFLDLTIEGKNHENKYKVDQIFIHPNASLLQNTTTKNGHHRHIPLNNDIAILKLSSDIQFSDNIQALPLAPKNFRPKNYGDSAIIVGFGDTDTLTTSAKLQKGDALIRSGRTNTGSKGRWPEHKHDINQLLFLGGYQDGNASPSGSGGDSGGPAVCRDPNGYAVLCGLTSFGAANKENCEKFKTEDQCYPTAYVKIDYFREWIIDTAKDQKKARVMRQPIYGKDVPYENYPHQVKISPKNKQQDEDEHTCGGTLIAQDIVLTAGHCVANDDGTMKDGLLVTQMETAQAQRRRISGIKVLPGFQTNGKKNNDRPKRIAVFATNATWVDPYYKNDLALVKLSKPMDIEANKLPKIAKSNAAPGSATEVAWVTTEPRRKGNLTERRFNLLSHEDCQKRMDRLTYAGYNIQVDRNVVCGVEKYSGGSKCDRSLGGGVLCEGNQLCGVQAFRLCEFAVPSAFVDVGANSDWIMKNMKNL